MPEAAHITKGNEGEDLAASFLSRAGYRILERNWRYRHLEIDIIAVDGDELVIIEVKTRKEGDPLLPQDLVPVKKQKRLIEATDAYIRQSALDRDVRFDIILVYTNGKSHRIEHIPGAFYPTL